MIRVTKEEGHYTIKRVPSLPKRGNANWLYAIMGPDIKEFHRWDAFKSEYETLPLGLEVTSIESGANVTITGAGSKSDPYIVNSADQTPLVLGNTDSNNAGNGTGIVNNDAHQISAYENELEFFDVPGQATTVLRLSQTFKDTLNSSPLTTKGDLYTYTTVSARLGVGTIGQVLTADPVEPTGLKWVTPGGGSGDMTKVVYDPAFINEQLVGLTATQTLTNKTLSSPKDGISNVNGHIWAANGTNFESVLMSGDATIASDGTVTVVGGGSDSVITTAQVNETSGIIKGQVLYLSGAIGGFAQVSLADNTDYSKADVLVVALETKTNNQQIQVLLLGTLENINTTAFTEGQLLYLGTSGNITAIHPTGLNAVVRIGRAVKINASTGSIFFSVSNLTTVANVDGFVRNQIVNTSTGTSAIVNSTYVNDAGHYLSINMTGSNNNALTASEAALYNTGHGLFKFINDGNKDFIWNTDVTDSHNLSFTEKMRLTAAGFLTAVNLIGTNTGDNSVNTLYSSLVSNVTTDLSFSRTPTTVTVISSDGTNTVLPEADTTNAGILGSDKWDEIVANTSKVTFPGFTSLFADYGYTEPIHGLSDLSDVNTSTPTTGFMLIGDGVDFESRALLINDVSDFTDNSTTWDALVSNVPTSLTIGTITGTTFGITSDGSADDVVLPEANTTQAGLLGSDKWDEIVANTAKDLSLYLPLGGGTMSGSINMSGGDLTSVGDITSVENISFSTGGEIKGNLAFEGLRFSGSDDFGLELRSKVSGSSMALILTDTALIATVTNAEIDTEGSQSLITLDYLTTNFTTNVSTDLSLGTLTATTMDVNSSDGTNATLIEADTTNAGLLGSDKWDEIVANTVKTSNIVQTSIVGITGTKAEFDTAVTDGNFMYIGDVPTAHTHTFASLTSKPTTIGGYGITDGLTDNGSQALTTKTLTGTTAATTLFTEDFETGFDPKFTFDGDLPWTIAVGGGNGGGDAAVSGAIGFSQTTGMTLTITTISDISTLTYDFAQSSEDCCDFVIVYLNGIEILSEKDNNTTYASRSIDLLGAKEHVIRWEYHTDSNTTGGTDNAHIDNILITSNISDLLFDLPVSYDKGVAYNEAVLMKKGLTSDTMIFTPSINNSGMINTGQILVDGKDAGNNIPIGVTINSSVIAADSQQRVFFASGQVAKASTPNSALSTGIRMYISTANSAILGDPEPFGSIQLGQAGKQNIQLNAVSNAGASQINSRLQVGYDAQFVPDLNNLNILAVNGNTSIDGDLIINTDTAGGDTSYIQGHSTTDGFFMKTVSNGVDTHTGSVTIGTLSDDVNLPPLSIRIGSLGGPAAEVIISDTVTTINTVVLSSSVPTLGGHLINKTFGDLAYAPISGFGGYLHLAGPNQTVTSNITFGSNIVSASVPTLDTHLTNKLYVDSEISNSTQTSIVGITGTKAQFDTAVTDGDFMYTGDDAPLVTTGTEIDLGNTNGNLMNMGAVNTTNTYTLSNTAVDGGNAMVLYDSTGDTVFPAVTGSTLTRSDLWEATTLYYLNVINNSNQVEHYWVKKDVDTVDLLTPIEDTSSTLDLSNNIAGNFTSMASANTATTYTVTGVVTGGWAKVLINAASEPTVTGATKTTGATFASSTDMYMFVWNNGNRTEFYFLTI